jgi:NAD(P)-dependent dehydrogenase (short-subunit alcohol dehydrogenase family)
MTEPADRVVMVSGATGGIGGAIASRLHADGYRLSLGARNPGKLAGALLSDTERVFAVPYDAFGGTSAATTWVEATIERFGAIDVLVNSAGIYARLGFAETTEADLDATLAVNTKAPFLLSQAAWPHLKASGHGKLINIASLGGVRVKPPTICVYAMSKHALMAMTHSLRMLGWNDGIRVTAILPGPTDTPMIAGRTDMSSEDMIAPATIADIVAHVLSLPQNASVAIVPVNAIAEQLY